MRSARGVRLSERPPQQLRDMSAVQDRVDPAGCFSVRAVRGCGGREVVPVRRICTNCGTAMSLNSAGGFICTGCRRVVKHPYLCTNCRAPKVADGTTLCPSCESRRQSLASQPVARIATTSTDADEFGYGADPLPSFGGYDPLADPRNLTPAELAALGKPTPSAQRQSLKGATAYSIGATIEFHRKMYQCVVAGTSGPTGSMPRAAVNGRISTGTTAWVELILQKPIHPSPAFQAALARHLAKTRTTQQIKNPRAPMAAYSDDELAGVYEILGLAPPGAEIASMRPRKEDLRAERDALLARQYSPFPPEDGDE